MENVPVFGTRVDGCPYVVRPSAYALVRNSAGELAVVITPEGTFLPGGGIEPHETPQEAIEREAAEECGFVLAIRRVIGNAVEIVYSKGENTCFEKRCVFFIAEVISKSVPTEHDHELFWLDSNHAIDTLTHESHRWAVRLISEHESNTI